MFTLRYATTWGLTAILAGSLAIPAGVLASGGQLEVVVVDAQTKQPIPCRMHLRTADGKTARKPKKTIYWHDHFVIPGQIVLSLPAGNYQFQVERGLEYKTCYGHFEMENFANDSKTIELPRAADMAAEGWWSGDLDLRRDVRDVELLMQAEDLHVAEVVTWGNHSDVARSDASGETLFSGDGNRFYHRLAGSYLYPGGELLLFHLPEVLKLQPPTAEYPSPVPKLLEIRKDAGVWVDVAAPYAADLPMLVASSQIDSIQVAHRGLARDATIAKEGTGKARDRLRYPPPWGNALWSQDIYFHLLNCGLRLPPTAGSGSGLALNPAGYNRVYVHVDGPLTWEQWWENLRAGHVTITNGPLLRPLVQGQLPGYTFRVNEGAKLSLEIGLTLSTREPISYLEIIKNGKVEHSIRFDDYVKAKRLPPVEFDSSGWFLVRATTDVQPTYRFAMTGPYYVEVGYGPRISKASAQFFLDWLYERAKQISLTDPAQREDVMRAHRAARDYWRDILAKANAE